ncbi:hypothetical protein B9P99_01180 [Candidatus Marsarchaeota G1 archaeon OSP_B]|jgi:Uncharacterized conserved protein related to C-terminal domain of eukaryotic chaperone, SACSIN, COG2250|uniref:HEPN domain-containing protein n=4 Tax=Candidatus Marsarchaeota group 1 TaxID=2203770 RepID=A0A2R6AJZ8_9ARCH|nr:MAG: hypothetical protein B9Q01_02705 [Candidatus Marsarchaeota G1 archaeon OSP_D]PSN86675.1 MAG: hypothetical protein B9Q02_01565 [Candidatus Marsarchaeota G1 archaeon BE_D]PSN88937.1 MAG: hypothetical protein B9Q00_03475 [Candidatus Marsarchaeota G1 archaeon OSP_C]PSN95264.1 MAG: hypothetical protein B9P99_01180 [Candidatus Marsarchaeota G1 archaeon OSP_B]
MSFDYAELLLNRSLGYLEEAEHAFSKGHVDVCAVNAEIAAQLALKAFIVKLGYEPPRTHEIRKLLGEISRITDLQDVKVFATKHKNELIILEDARRIGQYGELPLDQERAEITLKTARAVIELVKKIWSL